MDMDRASRELETLIGRYPVLKCCEKDIFAVYTVIKTTYLEAGKLLVCGNGGSAADAEHIVGELMKGFCKPRRLNEAQSEALKSVDAEMGTVLTQHLQNALPAIALGGHVALSTAYMNDCNPLLCFAQQVHGYGWEKDTLLAISTSGNSQNVLYAAVAAKAKGMRVVALTGERESRLSALANACIRVPETETYKIQELHLPVYHCLCLMLENTFF